MWSFRNKIACIYLYFQLLRFLYVSGNQCGGNLTAKNGIISSPNFPNHYPSYELCIWKYNSSKITNMTLIFTDFKLEDNSSSGCEFDFVKVVYTFPNQTYGPFCGIDVPNKIVTKGMGFIITFRSDRSNERTGFRVEYSIDEDECLEDNGGCQQICQNTIASYICLCHEDFVLHENGHDCYNKDGSIVVTKNPKAKYSGKAAMQWMRGLRQNGTVNERWGNQVNRIAISLYIADSKYFDGYDTTGNEIIYEVDNFIMNSLLRDRTDPISDTEMALYIHALLVTCLNPRNFHGIDLISMLRRRMSSQGNYTSPLAMLALCNANDNITTEDISKVINIFHNAQRSVWTSTQALSLMALSCMAQQPQHTHLVSLSVIKNMSLEMIQEHNSNGNFTDVYVTAMITQAILASGTQNNMWNVVNAVDFLIASQMEDGSYGNFLNTYYAMPVLYYKSLVNISSFHCKDILIRKGTALLNNINNDLNQTMWINYSAWFGDHLDVVRSLTVRAKKNCSFFDVMKLAESVDDNYKFTYYIHDLKPYIYSLNEYQEDPENERFWFLYKINGNGSTYEVIDSSPVDVFPENKENYVMWYRKGRWDQKEDKWIKNTNPLFENPEFKFNSANETSLKEFENDPKNVL